MTFFFFFMVEYKPGGYAGFYFKLVKHCLFVLANEWPIAKSKLWTILKFVDLNLNLLYWLNKVIMNFC